MHALDYRVSFLTPCHVVHVVLTLCVATDWVDRQGATTYGQERTTVTLADGSTTDATKNIIGGSLRLCGDFHKVNAVVTKLQCYDLIWEFHG